MGRHSASRRRRRGPATAAPADASAGSAQGWPAVYARIVGAALARVTLAALATLLLFGAAPAVLGWTPTTVMTGSMEPRIHPGDIVVARPLPQEALAAGQVLLVDDPDHGGRLRLHRLVSVTDQGLILRGDANSSDDSTPVATTGVRGVGFLRIPLVGAPLVWFSERALPQLAVLVVVLLLLVAATRLDRALGRTAPGAEPAEPDPATTGPPPHQPSRRQPRAPRRARGRLVGSGFLVAAAVVVLVVATSRPASALYLGTTVNPASLLAAGSYPCLDPPVNDQPFLAYGFAEGSGTAALDGSGNGRTGTLTGGVTRVPGSCRQDDGPAVSLASGFVATPTQVSSAPTTMSMETWFSTRTTSGGRLLGFGSSQAGTSTSPDRQLYLGDSGKVVGGVYSNGILGLLLAGPQTVSSPAAYNDGKWHHVVLSLSGGATLTLYVDGVSVATRSVSAVRSTAGYWRVGADAIPSGWSDAPTSVNLNGLVDNAAVYSTALSAAQVQAHRTAGR